MSDIDFYQHCGKPEDHLGHTWLAFYGAQVDPAVNWCKGWR